MYLPRWLSPGRDLWRELIRSSHELRPHLGAGCDVWWRLLACGSLGAAELTQIEVKVFRGSCVFSACHGDTTPQQGLSLVSPTYGMLVDHPASEVPTMLRVAPGAPEGSYLWRSCLQIRQQWGSGCRPANPSTARSSRWSASGSWKVPWTINSIAQTAPA